MEWTATKREAEPDSAPSERSKASRTEQDKGCPWNPAPGNKQRWRKGKRSEHGEPEHHLPGQSAGTSCTPTGDGDQDLEAGLQVGTLRPTGQPRTASTTLCSCSEMEEGTGRGSDQHRPSDDSFRLPHGTEGRRRRDPHTFKAEEMKWLKDGHWCYQKWSPALGSLVVDETRSPLQHAKLVEALLLVLPLVMLPYMIHRFHATRPLAGNVTRNHGIPTGHLQPHQGTPDGMGRP